MSIPSAGPTVHGGLSKLIVKYCIAHNITVPDSCDHFSSDTRIPLHTWIAMLEHTLQGASADGAGIRIAQHLELQHFGVLAYIGLSCSTLGEAFSRLSQFNRLPYDVNSMTFNMSATDAIFKWGNERITPGQLADETAVALFVKAINLLIYPNKIKPTRIDFINNPPADLTAYQDFFDCPINFNAHATQIITSSDVLHIKLAQPDAELQTILERQALMLLQKLPNPDAFEQQLQLLITDAIHQGDINIEDIASQLQLSVKTLQRQLQKRNTTFQERVASIRQTLAKNYLLDPALTLSEIGFLLGYTEQSAFQRAFKLWTNQTPLQFRKNHLTH